MANISAEESPQFKMLSPAEQEAIMQDYMSNPNPEGGPATLNINRGGVPVTGPVFKSDVAGYGGPVGPLSRAQAADDQYAPAVASELAAQQPAPQALAPQQAPGGALSQAMGGPTVPRLPSVQEALNQYVPQDDSRNRYLALAAGFGSVTKTGQFGETLGNVASAVQQQRMQQEQLRMQYLPHIMQQVAQQQQMQYMMDSDARSQALLEKIQGGYAPAAGVAPSPTTPDAGGQASPVGAPATSVDQTIPGGASPQPVPSAAPAPAASGSTFVPRQVPPVMLAQINAMPLADRAKAREALVHEYFTPKYENINGNMVAVNDARFQPGFQAGVTTSADGTTTMTTPDGHGGVTVSAPKGALETKFAYQGGTLVPMKLGGTEVQLTPAEVNAYSTNGVVPQRYAGLVGGGQNPPVGAPQDSAQTPVSQGAGSGGQTLGVGQSPADAARALADVKLATEPGIKYATDSAATLQKVGEGISGKVSAAQELMQRIEQSRDALARFQSGGGESFRTDLAQSAQAIGAPKSMVDRIAGGDLSAAQEFQKYAAQQALQTLIQTMTSDTGTMAGRLNVAEMNVFNKSNPGLDTDPRAIEKMYNFATKIHNNGMKESDLYSNFVSDPRNPKDASVFANKWQHYQLDNGMVNPRMVTGEAMGTQAPKTPSAPTPNVSPSGWVLHTDAKGNKAYVSPDGKQFQEVK